MDGQTFGQTLPTPDALHATYPITPPFNSVHWLVRSATCVWFWHLTPASGMVVITSSLGVIITVLALPRMHASVA